MSGTRGGSNDAALPLIATEEIGGEQYQKIKIVNGAAGQTAAIGGDATNGLDVDVTRVQGTVTVDASGAAVPVTDNGGTLTVDGTVSVDMGYVHDAATAVTNVLSVGGMASATTPTGVTSGDVVRAYFDTYGRLHVVIDQGDNVTMIGRVAEGFTAAYAPVTFGGRASNVAPANVDQGDVVNARFRLDGAQTVYVENTVGITGTVSATDLDIRALSSATDSVAVSATDLDIRALSSATDSVAVSNDVWVRTDCYFYTQRFDIDADTDSVTISSGNIWGQTTIFNDSSAALYLDLTGGTASTSSFSVKVAAGGYYEVPWAYAGAITGCWESATGHARVTWIGEGWD